MLLTRQVNDSKYAKIHKNHNNFTDNNNQHHINKMNSIFDSATVVHAARNNQSMAQHNTKST